MTEHHCAGCGRESSFHPYVAVVRGDSGAFEAVPVCLDCWQDPAHRTTPIKGHFFARSQAREAVAAAGSSNLG